MREVVKFNTEIKTVTEALGDTDTKQIKIRGVALDSGISRNKINYLPEEMLKAAETMIGKPILDGHRDESVRNIIGKIVASQFHNNQILFEGILDAGETDIVRKCENGFIDKVSIGASYDEERTCEDANGIVIPRDIQFEELSLVVIPGVPNASIHQVIAEAYRKKIQEKIEGDKKMEETKIKELEEKMNTIIKENEELKAEAEAKVEAEKTETEAAAKAEAEVKEEDKKMEEQLELVKKLEEKVNSLETKLSEKSKIVEDTPAKENKFNLVQAKESMTGKRVFYSEYPEELY